MVAMPELTDAPVPGPQRVSGDNSQSIFVHDRPIDAFDKYRNVGSGGEQDLSRLWEDGTQHQSLKRGWTQWTVTSSGLSI